MGQIILPELIDLIVREMFSFRPFYLEEIFYFFSHNQL
ncbi:hypothetical protein GTCCBUS3UF5_36530 [Geobacillus thermoleovorans CCB_US3_UF5]|uniref:Uncharacterized protein n=2 Tax=Geobacillus TaxID=129337 RepID=A0A1Q5SHV1_9BACL|nr:hypothetical protein GTCCBUS3UF5_19790 [Geobacillus thermoleovorans CCB_US3_UF5]AEV20953.1 hypothetical protein GTCCBUS3UF5_36530 [Geobacillus thermoleovorans CCB_US3_UF5]OKO87582.1 hypothetical protein BRO54_3839 [Geobacillus proteiniphilus]